MGKKIAFFDIDGTLINVPTQMMEPSQKTVETLNAFQKAGNKIFIATARGAVPFSEDLISFDGFIGNDGHYIIYNNEVILDDLFTIDEINKLRDTFALYDGRYTFSGHENSWSTYWGDEFIMKHAIMFNHTDQKPDTLIEKFTNSNIKAMACCVLFKNAEDLYNAYHVLKDNFTMVVYDTGLIRMDVYRKGFTKGTAVRHMIEKLGFDLNDSYAFGDGENDLQMLQLVGHGVAMGNAVPKLKEVSKESTDSVLEDGIANYFKKNGLCL